MCSDDPSGKLLKWYIGIFMKEEVPYLRVDFRVELGITQRLGEEGMVGL